MELVSDASRSGGRLSSTSELRVQPTHGQLINHQARVGDFLRVMYKSGVGADAYIKLADASVLPVHLAIAAAHSGMFSRAIYKQQRNFDASFVPPAAVRTAVAWFYDAAISFRLADLPDLLELASAWEADGLKQALEDQLGKASYRQCVLIHTLNIATCPRARVSDRTRAVVLNNSASAISVVLRDPRFTKLSPLAVEALLSMDRLGLGEMEVARVLLRYLSFPSNRVHAGLLVQTIRHEYLRLDERRALASEASNLEVSLGSLFYEYLQSVPSQRRPPRTVGHVSASRMSQSHLLQAQSPNAYNRLNDSSGSPLNSRRDSIQERSRLPNVFSPSTGVRVRTRSAEANPYANRWASQMPTHALDLTRESLYELSKIPDMFKQKVVDMSHRAYDYGVHMIGGVVVSGKDTESPNPYRRVMQNRRGMNDAGSIYEMNQLPDPFGNNNNNYFGKGAQSPLGSTARSTVSATSTAPANLRRYSNTSLKDMALLPSFSQISLGDQPTSGVQTAKSFGDVTARQAKAGLFGSVAQPGLYTNSNWNPYGANSVPQNASDVSNSTSAVHSSSAASGVSSLNPYHDRNFRYVPTQASLVDINGLPDVFSQDYSGLGFEGVRPPSAYSPLTTPSNSILHTASSSE